MSDLCFICSFALIKPVIIKLLIFKTDYWCFGVVFFPTKISSAFFHMKLVKQVKELEEAISQHCGEREELIGHLHQIKEDHNSSSLSTESMAGKIKVRQKFITKYFIVLNNFFMFCQNKAWNKLQVKTYWTCRNWWEWGMVGLQDWRRQKCFVLTPLLVLVSPDSHPQALEGEVLRLSQSLESSLLEKGEIASRLNSTQDEVQQMRTGIEKLQVRIESDERKKKKMGELLKGDSQHFCSWWKQKWKLYNILSFVRFWCLKHVTVSVQPPRESLTHYKIASIPWSERRKMQSKVSKRPCCRYSV